MLLSPLPTQMPCPDARLTSPQPTVFYPLMHCNIATTPGTTTTTRLRARVAG